MPRPIVVVGASLAGLRAVETLRDRGYDGPLALVGDEVHRPYDRPPLSKQLLQGSWEVDRLYFRRQTGYDALSLDLRLGVRATALDVSRRRLTLDQDGVIEYEHLIVATGARPRWLPGLQHCPGVHVLRGLDDALGLRRDLERASHVTVIGAGFIGLEVAASCRARGLQVTVLEAAPSVLSSPLGATAASMVSAMHRDQSVDLRTGVTVSGVIGDDERVRAVRLSDGTVIETDAVVVGVGVQPNTDWLDSSGLEVDNGIVCDERGRAGPGVYAAGDVARLPNAWMGHSTRIEHWTNAVEQGVFVAESLLDPSTDRRFSSVPYFWSDQFDRKLQCAGRVRAGDEMTVVTGTVEERRFAALYRRDDRVAACVAVNHPKAFIACRALVSAKAGWETALTSLG